MAHLGDYSRSEVGDNSVFDFMPQKNTNLNLLVRKPYQITGTVLDKNGVPSKRTIVVINETSFEIEGVSESDPTTGEYVVGTASVDGNLVVFTGEPNRNAIVYRGVVPND